MNESNYIQIDRQEATSLGGAKNCKYHIYVEDCLGFLASGRTPENAFKNLKQYYKKSPEDFNLDIFPDIDSLLRECQLWEVVKFS